jgi:hypothetical protein
MLKAFLVTTILSALGSTSVCAGQLFESHASRGGTSVSSSDSTFAGMIEAAARLPDAFPGRAFRARITYMGVPSTFTVTPGFDGKTASLRLECVGFEKTFTGSSAAEINRKVEKFLNDEGVAIAAKFSEAVAAESAFALSDGNPASTTASAARSLFFSQGISPAHEDPNAAQTTLPQSGASSLAISRGNIEADIAGRTYRGEQLRIEANLASVQIGKRMRLEVPVTAEYTDIEGTEIYGAGASVAAPITMIAPTVGQPFGWKLVPVAGLHTRASFSAATGGVAWHAGLLSAVDWRISDVFSLTLINQVTSHHELPVEFGGYTMDSDIDQTILKNGLCLTTRLSPGLHANLYGIHTQFLNDAAVASYGTAGFSLDVRTGRRMSVGAAIETDFADNYRSLLGRLWVNWTW